MNTSYYLSFLICEIGTIAPTTKGICDSHRDDVCKLLSLIRGRGRASPNLPPLLVGEEHWAGGQILKGSG